MKDSEKEGGSGGGGRLNSGTVGAERELRFIGGMFVGLGFLYGSGRPTGRTDEEVPITYEKRGREGRSLGGIVEMNESIWGGGGRF